MDGRKSPLVWEKGTPRSALYGDIYFSLQDGLAESRAVFLEGCGLPDAWAGRDRFVVAELGFGTGLNVCALLHLWKRTRAPGARLEVFTVELDPIAREDAARALAAFPEIGEAAGQLLDRWPGRARGVHRLEIEPLGAAIDIAVMEAAEALGGWPGKADAWFLDGFSPALNPAMWRDEVLDLVARRSAPGARVATFTVAGAVRRGLADRAFVVEKKPGYGRKRQRLEARFIGGDQPTLVLGSGIAGAAVARAFSALGHPVKVYEDPECPPASGNPAALATPALDAGGGARAALYAQAFARAVALYSQIDGAVIAQGAYQLETEARDAGRFDKIVDQDLFPEGGLSRLSPEAVCAVLDESTAPGGLFIRDGLVVDPAVVRGAWAPKAMPGRAIAIRRQSDGLTVDFADGRSEQASLVVIACGHGAAELLPDGPALTPVRGQASVAEGGSTRPVAFGAYAIPTRTGVLYGASHDRGEADLEPRPAQDAENLRKIALRLPRLAAELKDLPTTPRVGVRATTKDRMPLAGEIAPGVYILSGLGSRGFTTAPILAEHIAALALGRASPLSARLAATVAPGRWAQP